MTREEFLKNYWSYYLMLEQKFINTTMYVDLSTQNYSTFSNEFASLLQLIGAELDSFFKVYCSYATDSRKTIEQYATFILTTYPTIKDQEIIVINRDFIIKPFEHWDVRKAGQSLDWWTAFCNIKHNRTERKTDASLKNVLYILAALFLLEMKYLQNISTNQDVPDIPDKESSIFTPKNWSFKYSSANSLMLQIVSTNTIDDNNNE